MPPGWYYAQGDPPGTQRYWDGNGWQGGPQPAGGAAVGGMGAASGATMGPEHGSRIVAALIDWAPMVGLAILQGIFGAISDVLGVIFWFLWVFGGFGWWVYNWLYMQGTTGQTLGKKTQNIRLVSAETGLPLGIGGAFIRGFVIHGIAYGCTCGLLGLVDTVMILINDDRQRFSDQQLKYKVVPA